MSFSAQQTLPALTKLQETLSGEVVRPGDEGYEYGIARWSESRVKPAAYVVFPKTNEDVVEAIKFAREQSLELAVCAGGYSFSGSSSTQGGLVIHLGKYLNGARCDPEKRLLYVEGGATWETVDKVGMEHGLATVGANVNRLGVGGLALGGGYGWLTGKHGMTVDNVVQITVVLASGEVVTANEKEHPDLFWGCRGAGSNFGVVTEFVLRAHPQRQTVFVAHLIYTMDKLGDLLNAANEWYETAVPDEGLHWGVMRVLPGTEPGIPTLLATYYYNGDATEGRKAAKKLYDVGPVVEQATEDMPYIQLNALQNDETTKGRRTYITGLPNRSKPSLEGIRGVLQAQEEAIKSDSSLVHSGIMFDYTPKQAIMAVPLEATAFAGRGIGIEGIIYQAYSEPALDDLVQRQVGQWSQILAEKMPVGDGAELLGGSYGNLSLEATASEAARVFGPNYKRLREVKRMYDPENVWNRLCPIEPAQLV